MRKRMIVSLAIVVVVVVVLVLVLRPSEPTPTITVGSKGFTEQLIIGEMMAQLLAEQMPDVNVKLEDGLSSSTLREGIEVGALDIIAEYTGTAWMVHAEQQYDPADDAQDIYDAVKAWDEAQNDIIWLNAIWNNNTYAFASWSQFVDDHGLTDLSSLAALYRAEDGKIHTSVTDEWALRPDGRPAFELAYNFAYDDDYLLVVEAGLTLLALEEEEVDVGMIFGTDPQVEEFGWHVYPDDQSFFPPYDMTPSVRGEVLGEFPQIATILNELVATFPGGGEPFSLANMAACQALWAQLNWKVDFEGMMPDEVAEWWLTENGLIGG